MLVPSAREADELQNHDERAGRGFRETEAVHHLPWFQPMEMVDGVLRHVRQHRIRAAESDDRRFTEKNSFPKNRLVGSENDRGKHDRRPPDRQSYRGCDRCLPPASGCGRGCDAGLAAESEQRRARAAELDPRLSQNEPPAQPQGQPQTQPPAQGQGQPPVEPR